MNLYEQIFLRKSVRKYNMTPLAEAELLEMEDFIRQMRPLLPDVEIGHRIVGPEQIKGILTPRAPHYLILSGEAVPYRDLCAGFLFQQLDLYLSYRGFGTCWLGAAKGRDTPFSKTDILAISFGEAVGAHTRALSAFKRKPLGEISSGEDPRLEAARLAPSGINAQPWYFIARDGVIHVYQAAAGKLRAMFYDLEELDVGIALCHLALATEALGGVFRFETQGQDAPPAPRGFVYTGTVF